MSQSNGQASQSEAKAKSAVATNAGTIVAVPDLVVSASRINNFVEMYRKTYFEDHGLEWCLDEIISRGMAEIKRQVKTAAKTAENRASGELLRSFNMSPAQAKQLLAELQALKAAEANKTA